jgi:hypothetical protein
VTPHPVFLMSSMQCNFLEHDPGDEDGFLNPMWKFEPGTYMEFNTIRLCGCTDLLWSILRAGATHDRQPGKRDDTDQKDVASWRNRRAQRRVLGCQLDWKWKVKTVVRVSPAFWNCSVNPVLRRSSCADGVVSTRRDREAKEDAQQR